MMVCIVDPIRIIVVPHFTVVAEMAFPVVIIEDADRVGIEPCTREMIESSR
jgi:hypothetical protein